MKTEKLSIGSVPAIIFGEQSDKIYLFIHGKCGNKEEALFFAETVCKRGWQVLSIDLPEHGERKDETKRFVPWSVVPELKAVYDYAAFGRNKVAVRANSIGAWFSMMAFENTAIEKCLFVSPIVNMNQLIEDMMKWASVSVEMLKEQRTICTSFGETLSWDYYCYAKQNIAKPPKCFVEILYAENDTLTDRLTIDTFAKKHNCKLTVMKNGEHWFHTTEQLKFLKSWTENNC